MRISTGEWIWAEFITVRYFAKITIIQLLGNKEKHPAALPAMEYRMARWYSTHHWNVTNTNYRSWSQKCAGKVTKWEAAYRTDWQYLLRTFFPGYQILQLPNAIAR